MHSKERLRDWLEQELKHLRADHLDRTRLVVERRWPGHVRVAGRDYIDFSSNDYLGLATDPRIEGAVADAVSRWGWGAGASALVGGYSEAVARLEEQIAAFEGTEAAIVFPSGYAANLATIASLAGPGDVIFSARRNHASLVDGSRLSRARIEVQDFNDIDRLDRALAAAPESRKLLVADSVFSMDGDIAPLKDLCDLADRYKSVLHVDEAHATGVLGERGRGAADQWGVEDRLPYRMGTLSKALGGVGGFIAGDRSLVDWLVAKARSYVYSTALPPACAVASSQALAILAQEPWRREVLKSRIGALREGLAALGWSLSEDATPIIPLIVGSSENALRLAGHLREEGFWAVAIRPPTVPVGTARVRLSVSCAHNHLEIQDLVAAVDRFRRIET